MIPPGVTQIENATFQDAHGLASITLPAGLTSIGGWAFDRAYSLRGIRIPASVTSFGPFAFHDAGAKGIVFEGDAPSVGVNVFLGIANYSGSKAYLASPTLSGFGNVGDDFHGLTVELLDLTATPGAPQLSGTPSALINSASASISFSGEENATFTCSVDGGEYAACGGSPMVLSGLSDGDHSLSVKQTNAFTDNTSEAATASWTVDATAPAAPVALSDSDPMPSGVVKTQGITIMITGDGGDDSRLECSKEGGEYFDCGTNGVGITTMYDMQDGPHSFAVREVDAAGNVSQAATYNWTVDTIAPGAPNVTSPTSADTLTGADVPFEATSDGAIGLSCKLDDGAWAPCPSSIGAPGDGSTITVGGDTLLHWGETSTTDPIIYGINSGSGPQWIDVVANPFGRSFTATEVLAYLITNGSESNAPCEEIAGFMQWMAGGDLALATSTNSAPDKFNTFRLDCSSTLAEVGPGGPGAFKGLTEGSHTLSVKAVDAAGNESDTTDVTWTVLTPDTTAPDAPVLTGAPASVTTDTAASIGFSGEDGATFTCSVDGGDYTDCGGSPKVLSDLSLTNHSLSVKATDAAGNVSEPATASWTVEAPAPTSNSPFNYTDDGTSITITGCNGSCPTSLEIPATIDGKPVTAIGYRAFMFKTTVTSITLPDSLTTIGGQAFRGISEITTITIPASVTSIGAGAFQHADGLTSVRFLGNAPEVGTEPFAYVTGATAVLDDSTLTGFGYNGELFHRLTVTGGVDAPAADTTAPDAPTITTTSVSSGVVRPSIAFTRAEQGGTVECKLNSSNWATCSSPFVPSADLASGDYAFQVRQADASGNVSDAASFGFHVTAPVVVPSQSFAAVTFPSAPSWYMVGHTGHWQIKVQVSNGGDTRGAAQPLSLQISTVAHPDPRLPSRASRNWKVVRYSESFTWNGDYRTRPLWIRVGTKGGKWTAWTPIVKRTKP